MSIAKVVLYNPEWKQWFSELKAEIWPYIFDIAYDVVHVGGTSIEGMSARASIVKKASL